MSMAFRLTRETYYSPARPHVSMSQVKDYMLSPRYYKRKYVDRDPELVFRVTDPMKRGMVVDELLTGEGVMRYKGKVLKSEDFSKYNEQKLEDPRFIVPKSYWEEALEIGGEVMRHPIWSWGIDGVARFQVILTGKIGGLRVCGLADRIDDLGDKKYRLIDLKVVSTAKISSKEKWMFNCQEMKYYHQLALYQYLFCESRQIPLGNVECCHVVGAYVQKGVVLVRGYRFGQEILNKAFDEVVSSLRGIKERRFDEGVIGWRDADVINPKVYYE